jgi:hypothetical protein
MMVIKPSQAMLDKNIELLRKTGHYLGRRVLSCNIRDPQVLRSKWNWQDSLSEKPVPPDIFLHKIKHSFGKYKITLRVNDEYLVADIRGIFGNSFVCSFNHPKIYGSEKFAPAILYAAYGLSISVNHRLW